MRNFYFLCVIIFSLNVYSQQIINNDFEDWYEKFYYENPEGGYLTSNAMVYVNAGYGNVSKINDATDGLYALKLETINSSAGPIQGMVFIGQPGDNGISGGMPYTERPDSLVMFIKYHIQESDTALIGILLKKEGQMIGGVFEKIAGIQQEYLRVSFPFMYISPSNPDTIVVALMSSLPEGIAVPGSYICIDNIQLINANSQIPNNSFENWIEYKFEEATGWQSLNFLCKSTPSVAKTTDAYSGQYAMRIENVELIMGDTIGIITNGYFTFNDQFIGGGLKINSNPKKLSFYYKYFPATQNDFGLIAVTLFNQGIVDTTLYGILTANNDYTLFEMYFNDSVSTYDTLNIALLSGMMGEQYSSIGNVLIVDNFNIEYYSSNSNKLSYESPKVFSYPNPFDNETIIYINSNFDNKFIIHVYDFSGKLIYENIQNSNVIKLTDKEIKSNGVYRVVILSCNKLYETSIIKEK